MPTKAFVVRVLLPILGLKYIAQLTAQVLVPRMLLEGALVTTALCYLQATQTRHQHFYVGTFGPDCTEPVTRRRGRRHSSCDNVPHRNTWERCRQHK